MSYSFTLRVENGEITAEVSEGMKQYLPDGTFYISGHEDEFSKSLHASRMRPDGSVAVQLNAGTGSPKSA